jgi:bisphosphoglycerate-independent phosphoglycerate mutase (AlkP superfamily)
MTSQTSSEPQSPRPVILLLIDGWGIAPPSEANVLSFSHLPNFLKLIKNYPVLSLSVPDKEINQRYAVMGTGQTGDLAAETSLSQLVSLAGLKQLKLGTPDRLTALSYYFNGEQETKYPGEDWVFLPKVANTPAELETNLSLLRKELTTKLSEENYSLVVLSISGTETIAQQADLATIQEFVELIDKSLGKIVSLALDNNFNLIVSAASGGAERYRDLTTDLINKELSQQPVPAILVNKHLAGKTSQQNELDSDDLSLLPQLGSLTDLAPTILKLLAIKIPAKLTGKSLWSAQLGLEDQEED